MAQYHCNNILNDDDDDDEEEEEEEEGRKKGISSSSEVYTSLQKQTKWESGKEGKYVQKLFLGYFKNNWILQNHPSKYWRVLQFHRQKLFTVRQGHYWVIKEKMKESKC
jgi:hypothetical protein